MRISKMLISYVKLDHMVYLINYGIHKSIFQRLIAYYVHLYILRCRQKNLAIRQFYLSIIKSYSCREVA